MKTRAIVFLLAIFCVSLNAQKRVAILETVDKEGKIPYAVKLMIRTNLANAITSTPGYEGYERVDMESILGEHNFQRTGLVNDSEIKKLGEMTGASYILIAEAAKINNTQMFIQAKILDVETAKLENSASVYTNITVEDIDKNCRQLALNLLKLSSMRGSISWEGGTYEGELLNGKPHGKGQIIFSDSDNRKNYRGEWKYGQRNGKGRMEFKDADYYEGEWKFGSFDGYGVYYFNDGRRYEGNWLKDKKNGYGVFYWPSGGRYEGNWMNGNRHGSGTEYYKNGDKYVGSFAQDKRNGDGTYYYSDSSVRKYEKGVFKDGELNGQGKLVWKDGTKYVGPFVDGKQDGSGVYYGKNHRYEGTYYKGQCHGKGMSYYNDGTAQELNYNKGKRHGLQKYYFNGLKYSGSYRSSYYWYGTKVTSKEFYERQKKEEKERKKKEKAERKKK